MKPKIQAAKNMASEFGYDQIVVIGRRIDEGEQVTTYGCDEENAEIAARIGNYLKYKVMQWENTEYRANFLWPFEQDSIEEAAYEFANGLVEEYLQGWFETLKARIINEFVDKVSEKIKLKYKRFTLPEDNYNEALTIALEILKNE